MFLDFWSEEFIVKMKDKFQKKVSFETSVLPLKSSFFPTKNILVDTLVLLLL